MQQAVAVMMNKTLHRGRDRNAGTAYLNGHSATQASVLKNPARAISKTGAARAMAASMCRPAAKHFSVSPADAFAGLNLKKSAPLSRLQERKVIAEKKAGNRIAGGSIPEREPGTATSFGAVVAVAGRQTGGGEWSMAFRSYTAFLSLS
jgi:hypothetical protein